MNIISAKGGVGIKSRSKAKSRIKLIGIILAVIAVFVLLIYFHIFWWTMLALLVLIVVLLHFSVAVHVRASVKEGIDISAKYLFLTLYPRGKKSAESAPVQPNAPPTEYDFEELADLDDLDGPDDLPDEIDEEEEAPAAGTAAESSDDADSADNQSEKADTKDDKSERSDEKPKPANKPDKTDKSEKNGKLAALKDKFEMVKPYIPIGWKAVKKFCKAIRFEGVDVWAEVGRFDAHEAAIYYGIVQGALFDLLGKLALFFTLKTKRAEVRCIFGENKIDAAAELTVRVRPSTLIAIAFCTALNLLITFLRERRKRKSAASENRQATNAAEQTA